MGVDAGFAAECHADAECDEFFFAYGEGAFAHEFAEHGTEALREIGGLCHHVLAFGGPLFVVGGGVGFGG